MAAACSTGLEARPLAAVVSRGDYPARVHAAAMRIAGAADPSEAVEQLRVAAQALGAERAAFASFVRDGNGVEACGVLTACDPRLADELQGTRDTKAHPWVAYAMERLQVAVAERLGRLAGEHPVAFEAARACGFASTVLVPVHGPLGYTRRGLLCLGSATPGYFNDDAAFAALRLQARAVAFELHEWWIEQTNREVLAVAGLDETDRALLMHLQDGLTSKQIARKLAISRGAADSRIQRLNRRLGVSRRRGAVKLAVQAGLLDSPSSS